jgi:NADPH:quinone reductase-like Zn-dependent oxidoreductase
MKAVVFTRYGSPDVLELREVEQPTPRDDEVLIRVHAASLNDWDWEALHGTPFVNRLMFGLLSPKKQILGSDVAGRVEAVGKQVLRFQPGDAVFGDLSGHWGGFAEYVCAREDELELKPPGMTFEQAAAIPQAGLLALQGLRDLEHRQPGQKVLINGAGGGAGTFAIQIARLYGAEVTGVDSPVKLDMLRSMGIAHVIDYTREDFTKNGKCYDVILDVKATRSILDCARALSPNGTYVALGGSMARLVPGLLLAPWITMTTHKTIRLLMLKRNQGLAGMKELFETGKMVPVIDGPYELSEVPKAFRRFGEGLHKGKVVITVASNLREESAVPRI